MKFIVGSIPEFCPRPFGCLCYIQYYDIIAYDVLLLLVILIVSPLTDEPPNPGTTDPTLVSTATLFILRSIASFGEAVVYWEASDLNTNDITPTSGSVLFNDGETQASFQVSAQPDNVRELVGVSIV